MPYCFSLAGTGIYISLYCVYMYAVCDGMRHFNFEYAVRQSATQWQRDHLKLTPSVRPVKLNGKKQTHNSQT